MSSLSLLLLSFLVFSISNASATSPFVQFPSGTAAWNVAVSQDSSSNERAAATEASGIATVSVQQDRNVRRNLLQYTSGKTREAWEIPGSIVIITEDFRGNVFVAYPNKFFSIPYLISDFDWVCASALQEKQPISYQGKTCFHFRGQSAEAWIDSKTLFPVALKKGAEIATFTLLPAPVSPLVLPPKYQAALDYYNMSQGKPRQRL